LSTARKLRVVVDWGTRLGARVDVDRAIGIETAVSAGCLAPSIKTIDGAFVEVAFVKKILI
jgi:hypothetical protein